MLSLAVIGVFQHHFEYQLDDGSLMLFDDFEAMNSNVSGLRQRQLTNIHK